MSDNVRVVEPVERAGPAAAARETANILTLLRDTLLQRREASVLIVALA